MKITNFSNQFCNVKHWENDIVQFASYIFCFVIDRVRILDFAIYIVYSNNFF